MKQEFFDVMAFVESYLNGDEQCIGYLEGEHSQFVRFNHGLVRQAGDVQQQNLSLRLMKGKKHCVGIFPLSRSTSENKKAAATWIGRLRETLAIVADDPYYCIPADVNSTEQVLAGGGPDSREIVDIVTKAAQGLDFVGILAQGTVNRGLYTSFGQRNWFETRNFHLDWSLYSSEDKAVKRSYAGERFDPARFEELIAVGKEELALLKRPVKTLNPGRYRVYFAPSAMGEIFELLSWGGFAQRNLETKQSPLSRLSAGVESLHRDVYVSEDVSIGHVPVFNEWGFIKPQMTALVNQGSYAGSLTSPRTAREFGLESDTGANAGESPEALVMKGGRMASDNIAGTLGRGLYISNLWYLNYSDRVHCRMTGMTRFACFWVEGGEIVAPTNVMRFDETLYRMFGSHLEGLTQETHLALSASTYGGRSTAFKLLPGAFVNDFSLTL